MNRQPTSRVMSVRVSTRQVVLLLALALPMSSASANTTRIERTVPKEDIFGPQLREVQRIGDEFVTSSDQVLFSFDRSAAMVALDGVAVYGNTQRVNTPYPFPQDVPAQYTSIASQASLDWEVLIEPNPQISNTVEMQLEFGVAGFADFGFDSADFMSMGWQYEVTIDDASQPAYSTGDGLLFNPIPSLTTSPFTVPVGTPFNLRQSWTGKSSVDETLLPPDTLRYDPFAEFDYSAATLGIAFSSNGAPVTVDYTVNGGAAPLRSAPASQNDIFEQFTRLAIRGDISVLEGLESGKSFESLASNMPFRTVSAIANRLEILRNEETSEALRQGAIDVPEFYARQDRANRVGSLLRAEILRPTYDEFLASNRNAESTGLTGEILTWSFLWVFIFGSDPFYATYAADAPLALPLPDPAEFTFSAGPEAAGATLLLPPLLGGGTRSPEVLNSQVTVSLEGGAARLVSLTTDIASYEVLDGLQTGVNHGFYPEGGQVWSDVNLATGELTAYGEGLITNDLYPAERPIFVFQDIHGRLLDVDGETLVEATANNEPMIVPGAPGEAPASQPVAFAATRARYDRSTFRLHLMENTDASLAPDISVVLTPEDVFGVGLDNTDEPLIGAEVHVEPLLLRRAVDGLDIQFFDTDFEIRNDEGVFASGQFTQVRIDLTVMALIADVEFDERTDLISSAFIEDWTSDADRVVLLGRIGSLDLMADTELFTQSGSSATDFMAFTRTVRPVPEPTSAVLLLVGLCALPQWLFSASGSRQTTRR